MRRLFFSLFLVSGLAPGIEATVQILTPKKVEDKITITAVSYQVQHPLLKGSTFRAHPFPGLRQLIVNRKVSQNIYTANSGELFEVLSLPISKRERKRVLQQIVFEGAEGVRGEALPLGEEAQRELAAYFIAHYKEDATPGNLSKVIFLVQQPKENAFDWKVACAFLRNNQKGVVGMGIITKPALDLVLKNNCS
jgi:hypothetical protein